MSKTNKIKRIWVAYGVVKELAKVFNCQERTVNNALAFRSNSDLAKKIRHTALTEKNGIEFNN